MVSYTALLNTRTPRVDVVGAMDRKCARPGRAHLLRSVRVAVRVYPRRVLGVEDRGRRVILVVLDALAEVFRFRSLGLRGVIRLEYHRSTVDLVWYHVGIVVVGVPVLLELQLELELLVRLLLLVVIRARVLRAISRRRFSHLLSAVPEIPRILELATVILAGKRRPYRTILPALAVDHVSLRLHRLHRVAATVERQRYGDHQDAHRRYATGETGHHEAVVRVVLG